MHHFRLSSELHPELQRSSRRCSGGWVLPVVAVLAILFGANHCQASCSHYVQDRLHPAGSIELSELELAWQQVNERQPCHGPECRAPQMPSAPTSIALIVIPEVVRVGAVPVNVVFTFERPTRPSFDRPRSDLLIHSPINSILKPPC